MLVDQGSFDLAAHFMSDIVGATAQDIRDLSEEIQRVCEDACDTIERRVRLKAKSISSDTN